jgi:hypothetical protein
MAKSRFYTPQSITLVAGVTHKRLDDRSDVYAGEGEALERSGLLESDMLPAEGHCSVSWRPVGEQQHGKWAEYEPGYMKITRYPAGGYRVYLTVSREEQERRAAETERKNKEWERKCEQRKQQERACSGIPTEGQHAQRELGRMFKSHAVFRQWYADHLYRSVASEIKATNERLCRDGYDMAEETLDAFMDELADALSVLREGASVFNAKKRAARVEILRARIAAEDDKFQPFMDRLLAPL